RSRPGAPALPRRNASEGGTGTPAGREASRARPGGRPAVAWAAETSSHRRSAEEATEPVAQAAPGRLDRSLAAPHRVADVVAERGPDRTGEGALGPRFAPGKKRLAPDDRTRRGREAAGRRIHVAPDDPLRHRELARAAGCAGGAHEGGPDRQRPLRAGEPGRATAVETPPDPCRHVGS